MTIKSLTDKLTLRNGYQIPGMGFGTWHSPTGEIAENAVRCALENGYIHVDSAKNYKNGPSVGEGIKKSGVKREDIFVTSKLWNTERSYDRAIKQFKEVLKDLQFEYLDLFLIHWPASPTHYDDYVAVNKETWRAFTDLYKDGYIRAIGTSNFWKHHLDPLLDMEVPPMVNQIEFHPGFMQKELVQYTRDCGMLVEGWSPLGHRKVLNHPLMVELAEKYGKTTAHICIRWALQHDVIPLPKSVTPERIIDNTKVFDFEISPEDMARIDAMEECGFSGLAPDTNPY